MRVAIIDDVMQEAEDTKTLVLSRDAASNTIILVQEQSLFKRIKINMISMSFFWI